MRDASRCACWQVRLALVLIWVHASCVQSAEENLPQSKVPVGLSRCAGLARAGGAGAGAQRAEPSALARAAAGPGAGDAVRGRGRRGRPGERMEPHARQPGRRRGRSAAAAAVQGGERWPTQALPHAHVICFCAALGACAGLAREGLRHVRCCREREQARAGRVAATDSAASCLLTRMRPLSAQQFPGSAAPCLTPVVQTRCGLHRLHDVINVELKRCYWVVSEQACARAGLQAGSGARCRPCGGAAAAPEVHGHVPRPCAHGAAAAASPCCQRRRREGERRTGFKPHGLQAL